MIPPFKEADTQVPNPFLTSPFDIANMLGTRNEEISMENFI